MKRTNIPLLKSLTKPSLGETQFRLALRRVAEWGEPTAEVNGVFWWGGSQSTLAIYDRARRQIGFIIGIPIDYANGETLHDSIVFDMTSDSILADPDSIEEWLYRYAGRWLAVISIVGMKRVYVDCNASLGVVFDSDAEVAGSTAAALLDTDSYGARLRIDAFRRLGIANEGWFTSGLTAHDGVNRLLANHYLDLSDWVQRRHWPKPQTIRQNLEADDILQRIAALITLQLETLAAHGRVACALTGGYETRVLLGCAKDLTDRIDFVSVAFSGAARDIKIASSLAALKSLNHYVLPKRVATEDQADEWLYNSGQCVGGPLAREHPSALPLSDYDFFVGGLGGEVARGFLYRSTDTGSETLSADNLVARMGLPSERTTIAATEEWLRNTPSLPTPELLDLAYIELRMGPWGFTSSYTKKYTTEIHPLVCREIYELMFALPYACKRDNPLVRMIKMIDPHLLEVPINRYGDVRDQLAVVTKLLQPKRVAKKLRKLFG